MLIKCLSCYANYDHKDDHICNPLLQRLVKNFNTYKKNYYRKEVKYGKK